MNLFTEDEAWNLFRFAAFAEAAGWAMLILGIALKQYILDGNDIPVKFAGQIHGSLFIFYIIIVFLVYKKLNWKSKKLIIAAFASVPPFGSLIFEQYTAIRRNYKLSKKHKRIMVYGLIENKNKILVVQSIDSNKWRLPGGEILLGETTIDAISRIMLEVSGISIQISGLAYIQELHKDKLSTAEFYFVISNKEEFANMGTDKIRQTSNDYDEVKFVEPETCINLVPDFLKRYKITAKCQSKPIVTELISS
ncbi:MAG: hypothetical protein NVS1B10_02100 [Candidatus Saccharimonadales bacterium]